MGEIDYPAMSLSDLDQVLQKPVLIKELRMYLKTSYEMSEADLERSLDRHSALLNKIEKKNKKKAEAAVNEEFELAVKYKN